MCYDVKNLQKTSRYMHGARQIADMAPIYPPPLPNTTPFPSPFLFSGELGEGRPRALLRPEAWDWGGKSEWCHCSDVRPAPSAAGIQWGVSSLLEYVVESFFPVYSYS